MDAELAHSAQELVERLGDASIEYMQNRIAKFESEGLPRDHNQALRNLTEVERLLEQEN
jgi:hypothetical protein